MIYYQQVTKQFGKLLALNKVTVELGKGKSYALIGPNGSGKTTLIKSLLGLVVPSSGGIFFDGESVRHNWKYRERIGYMPQIGRYPDNMKIGQVIEMMKHIRQGNHKLDDDLIKSFALDKILDKRMHALSGGTRQKVSAALAFLFPSPVLILDEPTAGLDPVAVEILKEKVMEEREKGKLLLISSHIMSDLEELTTEVIYLHEGQIFFNNSIDDLMDITGETKLGKAIARLITSQQLNVTEVAS